MALQVGPEISAALGAPEVPSAHREALVAQAKVFPELVQSSAERRVHRGLLVLGDKRRTKFGCLHPSIKLLPEVLAALVAREAEVALVLLEEATGATLRRMAEEAKAEVAVAEHVAAPEALEASAAEPRWD